MNVLKDNAPQPGGISSPLVIFDLDGTLVNTLDDLAASMNEALKITGYPTHPPDDYRYFVGNGVKKLVERALPEECRVDETIQRVQLLYNNEYQVRYLDRSAPYEGIMAMLLALAARGYRLGVVSNKPDYFTAQIVHALFGDMFLVTFGQRDGVAHKPDPTAVLSAMKLARCSAHETLYVGDSNVDVYTGHRAGLKVVGCAWGFRGERELSEAGADWIVHHPAEVVSIAETHFLV